MHICFAYFTLLPCSWLSGSSISGSFLPVSCNRNTETGRVKTSEAKI
jgi:hypothetical protein